MTGNAALEELRTMKRPSRRKLDAVKSKHEGTAAWTRTAKKLHAQMVQDGGFLPSIKPMATRQSPFTQMAPRQASVAQMAPRQASVAQMAVRGERIPINEPTMRKFDQTRRYPNDAQRPITARPYEQTPRFLVPEVLLPGVHDPCPSLYVAMENANDLFAEASKQRESDNGCQQVLASTMAVAGIKMVVHNVYRDEEDAKTAATEIDRVLKIMGQHYDVPVACAVGDSWNSMMNKAGLAVAVKCMGANATVSTAVGQYMT